jgi:hypothetical protein
METRQVAMKWFRKHFGRGDYSGDRTLFKSFYDTPNSSAGMMMLVGSSGVGDNTVYVRIPEWLAGSFQGYEPSGPPEGAQVVGLSGAPRDLSEYIKMKS